MSERMFPQEAMAVSTELAEVLRSAKSEVDLWPKWARSRDPQGQTSKAAKQKLTEPLEKGWAACAERLPRTGVSCLVVCNETVQQIAYKRIGFGYACADGYQWIPVCDIDYDAIPDTQVTHWMLLPEPPKF